MRFSFFADIFDKWVTRSPDGRLFVNPPWEAQGHGSRHSFFLAPYNAPVKFIFIVVFCAALVAFIVNAKIVFPICAGVLAILYYALKESWLVSSSLCIESKEIDRKVGEKQPYQIRLKVKNQGDFGGVDANLYFEFAGSTKTKHLISLPEIIEGESVDVHVDLLADAGMGSFQLREVYLVTSDRFGLFRKCVKHDVAVNVEVCPEYVPMPPIKLNVAGRATHTGTIEAKTSGDSTSFLGVRDFRMGDSIRRIDWKRSARHLSLIVRDFEKLNSTDATIFIDNRSIGVFELNGLNSYEHLKDAVVTLCHTLIGQGVRIQVLVQDGRVLPFGTGVGFLEELVELVRDLKPEGGGSIVDFLQKNRSHVPPDSVVIPFFSAVDIDPVVLREVFYGWNSMRCEVLPVVIDIPQFERQVVRGMEAFSQQKMDLTFFRQIYMGSADERVYENLSRKIYENTILIGPGERIGDVYARMHP